jgi:pyrimidine-specific ribonucleoside hydrolase
VELILDVDTGVDDALAILFAVRAWQARVRAITCVDGNVRVEQVVANTLKVLDAAEAPDVPVARGAAAPLSGSVPLPPVAGSGDRGGPRHGRDGLADLGLPPSGRTALPEPAVALLERTIRTAPEPPTVVACGPLTNLALLQRSAAGLLHRLRRLIVVGGVATGEIATPADFNTRHDPEAARTVLGGGVPTTMYSLDVFYEVRLTDADVDRMAASEDPGTRLAGLLARHQAGRSRGRGACPGDAGAVMAAVEPQRLRTGPHPDWPAVRVAVGVSARAYRRLFLETLLR